jgi:hypothetical protein
MSAYRNVKLRLWLWTPRIVEGLGAALRRRLGTARALKHAGECPAFLPINNNRFYPRCFRLPPFAKCSKGGAPTLAACACGNQRSGRSPATWWFGRCR